MPQKTILSIEDNAEIQILVEASLPSFEVVCVKTLKEARQQLDHRKFDLLLLDLELPDGDGMKFLTSLSVGEHAQTPVFILTSQAETANKVIAFSLGVEDFVSKPFDPLELRARVEAKLKKFGKAQDEKNVLKLKDLKIDIPRQRVVQTDTEGEHSITLTSLEFRLLVIFAQSPERVFSRNELLDKVWGQEIAVTDRTVDTHIGHLRKKILSSKVKIETVINEGYRLN